MPHRSHHAPAPVSGLLRHVARLAAVTALAACGGGTPSPTGADTPRTLPAMGLPAGVVPVVCIATWGHVDGDGFRCAVDGTVRVVRVAAIDAPERGQSGWAEARRRLESLTPSGTLVACHGRDVHDRHLCRVFDPRGVPVAETMLSDGWAWFAVRYAGELSPSERVAWPRHMAAAQAARRGIWSRPDPMPPWTCRERLAQGRSCR